VNGVRSNGFSPHGSSSGGIGRGSAINSIIEVMEEQEELTFSFLFFQCSPSELSIGFASSKLVTQSESWS